MLRNSTESLGAVKLAPDHKAHGTKLGVLAFPGVSNPIGHVLDMLAKQK